MPAKLIVLEGADGSGKSTQTELVKKYFEQHKLKYEFFHFPAYGHNEFSKVIASYLRGEYGSIEEVDPYFVANIYAMDRFLFLPTLNKMLQENDAVLLDRYVLSNMAFQAAKYPDRSEESEKIKQWIFDFEFGFLKLPFPDINIYFDLPIEIIKERLNIREQGDTREYLNGKKDIHEASLELQSRVRENYLTFNIPSHYTNYKIVDCAFKLKSSYHTYDPKTLFEKFYKDDLQNVLFK